MVDYNMLSSQVRALTADVPHLIANLSNLSALLWQTLPDLNWVGFYRKEGEKLVLYPVQGKPACMESPVGKGVCGTAVLENKTQLVPDVHAFPGHIACDLASNSELVIPLHKDGILWGVLDMDSPKPGRFTEADQAGLEAVAAALEEIL